METPKTSYISDVACAIGVLLIRVEAVCGGEMLHGGEPSELFGLRPHERERAFWDGERKVMQHHHRFTVTDESAYGLTIGQPRAAQRLMPPFT